jgi:hypothetical protein
MSPQTAPTENRNNKILTSNFKKVALQHQDLSMREKSTRNKK